MCVVAFSGGALLAILKHGPMEVVADGERPSAKKQQGVADCRGPVSVMIAIYIYKHICV